MGRRQKEDSPVGLLGKIADEVASSAVALTGTKAKQARAEIERILESLNKVIIGLDPIKAPITFFDPADPRIIGQFVGIALAAQARHALADVPAFYGSGVYAIYYSGPFEAYQPIKNTENPIYVGKADPADGSAKAPRQQGDRLCNRLREHARTIRKAVSSLSIEHFTCRYLVVQSGWQTAAENYLIRLFRPIWNDEVKICYGIGKHGDNPATRANLRSPWDTMHHGREWAYRDPKMRDAKSRERIVSEIQAHFGKHPPYLSNEKILARFFDDLRQRQIGEAPATNSG